MKSNAIIITLALMIIISGCTQSAKQEANNNLGHDVRVSDHYALSAVNSYDVFEADIEGHLFMLVRLSNGECFPMLCRKTQRGIYPIPQSVFAESGKERWRIMCEPHIRNSDALMLLNLSRIGDNLFLADKKLKAAAKVPLLSTPPS